MMRIAVVFYKLCFRILLRRGPTKLLRLGQITICKKIRSDRTVRINTAIILGKNQREDITFAI